MRDKNHPELFSRKYAIGKAMGLVVSDTVKVNTQESKIIECIYNDALSISYQFS